MGSRIGSIDIFRGLCIFLMLFGHIGIWWLSSTDLIVFEQYILPFIKPIGKAAGFLFVSGSSLTLSYSKKFIDYYDSHVEKKRILRNTYYLRAFILFILAISINLGLTLITSGAKIYDWWILFTISFCLFLSWPLMKLSKSKRIAIGITLLIFNLIFQNILKFTSELSPISNFLLDFLFPSDTRQNPIISFFPFFLFGTVFGSFLTDIDFEDTTNTTKFLKKFSAPLLLISGFTIVFSIFLQFPKFLSVNSFSWILYSLGLNTFLLSLLITIEKISKINFNSKYNILFYFSYYSLTLYLLNYVFMLTSFIKLDFMQFLFLFSLVFSMLFLSMKFIFNNIKGLFSLKYVMSVLSEFLSLKFEELFYKKHKSAFRDFIIKLKFNIYSNPPLEA
ncbi:MAG: heparan-alpha-glucosaminide N-acetyltransferase domain-containing protein [Promethearchaeati archaeon]